MISDYPVLNLDTLKWNIIMVKDVICIVHVEKKSFNLKIKSQIMKEQFRLKINGFLFHFYCGTHKIEIQIQPSTLYTSLSFKSLHLSLSL